MVLNTSQGTQCRCSIRFPHFEILVFVEFAKFLFKLLGIWIPNHRQVLYLVHYIAKVSSLLLSHQTLQLTKCP
jgi:hypothetical protein